MTQATLIEIIDQHHPGMSHAEIMLRLNNAQDDFCAKTELIRNTYRQLTVAGKRYYPLHADILKILKVQLDDIEIPRLLTPPIIDDDEFDGATGRNDANKGATDYAWYIDSQRIAIVEHLPEGLTIDGNTTHYQSISTSDKEIRLYTIGQAIDFTTNTALSSDLPSQFHEALAYKVIADGYLKGESLNVQLAQLFEGKYMSFVKEGKKHAKSNFVYSGIIKPQDF